MKGILRAPHLLLLLSAALNLAMLFAPIAYASNFRTNVYAEVYGSWAYTFQALEPGSPKEVTWFYEDGFLLIYGLFSVLGGLWLLFILFFRSGDGAKMKILPTATGLQIIHLGLGILLFLHAKSFVGMAAPEYLEASFQRELLFHLFIIGFTLSARRRYRKAHAAQFSVGHVVAES